jgi:hypothetical protein
METSRAEFSWQLSRSEFSAGESIREHKDENGASPSELRRLVEYRLGQRNTK